MEKSKTQLLSELEKARRQIDKLQKRIANSEEIMTSIMESEKEKRLILDSLSEYITLYDKDSKILYVNKTAVESLGLTPDDVIGLRCSDVFEKFALGKPKCEPCLVKEAITKNKFYQGIRRSSDGKYWYERVSYIPSENRDKEKYLEVALNITHQVEVEEVLKKSEEKYRGIIENTSTTFIC